MGIFDKIRGEFVDIVEWLDQSNDTIVYRFQRHNNEIKMGAKLTVRPGQKAVFINEGQIADTFSPGLYDLTTQNLPLLSTLKGWQYGFNSPFKAEVYFFNTKIFTNLKWGTPNAITIRDPELGPVRLRAFGSYNIRVADPAQLIRQLVSTDGLFQVDEVSDQIRNMIITAFATWFGRGNIPLFDFASRYGEMGDTIRAGMQPEVQQFGLELTQLLIESVSLPPEVETALDKRASMGILGNMQQYAQFQAANAVEASANNAGGGNQALDFGVGLAMGQQLISNLQGVQAPPPAPGMPGGVSGMPPAPPPPPVQIQWFISRGGQNLGPFTPDQLPQNGLTAQTHVWRSGMEGWKLATELPELAAVLASIPPAPPVS
uniref:SPFH domain-containing protein n=1 Tax=Trichocoleus desertorum TaxID=1481672 RepID=UPI0025B484ED|nr:SPFH domain-containing protein [Trichocoleus desertorum]